jgi:tetratricopeptide (TPR) repeat protein
MRGELDVAQELLERAQALVDDLGFAQALTRHAFGAGPVLTFAGDLVGAEKALRAAYQALDRVGLMGYLVSIGPMLAEALLALDRVDEALEITARVRELAFAEDVDAASSWRRAHAVALARKGEAAEALRLANESVEIIERTDYLDDHGRALAARGDVLLLAGRHSAAANDYEAAIRIQTTKGNIGFVRNLRKLSDTLF